MTKGELPSWEMLFQPSGELKTRHQLAGIYLDLIRSREECATAVPNKNLPSYMVQSLANRRHVFQTIVARKAQTIRAEWHLDFILGPSVATSTKRSSALHRPPLLASSDCLAPLFLFGFCHLYSENSTDMICLHTTTKICTPACWLSSSSRFCMHSSYLLVSVSQRRRRSARLGVLRCLILPFAAAEPLTFRLRSTLRLLFHLLSRNPITLRAPC